MKLSDSKFIKRSMEERTVVKERERFHADDASALRGIFDKHHREARMMFPEASGSYEAVSFQDPDTGIRRYGYIIGKGQEGTTRVELGDGEYMDVPHDELRRLGSERNSSHLKMQLRAAFGRVSTETNGVRADMHDRFAPLSVDPSNSIELLSVGYASSVGMPSDNEIRSYVSRFHPTAKLLDVDDSMPGLLGLSVQRVAEHEVEAEMGPAAGGEVTEVFDPQDEDDYEDGTERSAAKGDEDDLEDACWEGYKAVGLKKGKGGKMVPNCVPEKKKAFEFRAYDAQSYDGGSDDYVNYYEDVYETSSEDEDEDDVGPNAESAELEEDAAHADIHKVAPPRVAFHRSAAPPKSVSDWLKQTYGPREQNQNRYLDLAKGKIDPQALNALARAAVERRLHDDIGKMLAAFFKDGGGTAVRHIMNSGSIDENAKISIIGAALAHYADQYKEEWARIFPKVMSAVQPGQDQSQSGEKNFFGRMQDRLKGKLSPSEKARRQNLDPGIHDKINAKVLELVRKGDTNAAQVTQKINIGFNMDISKFGWEPEDVQASIRYALNQINQRDTTFDKHVSTALQKVLMQGRATDFDQIKKSLLSLLKLKEDKLVEKGWDDAHLKESITQMHPKVEAEKQRLEAEKQQIQQNISSQVTSAMQSKVKDRGQAINAIIQANKIVLTPTEKGQITSMIKAKNVQGIIQALTAKHPKLV